MSHVLQLHMLISMLLVNFYISAVKVRKGLVYYER